MRRLAGRIGSRTSPRDLVDAGLALRHLGLLEPAHTSAALRAMAGPLLRGHRSPALLVHVWARSTPDRPALVSPGRTWSFAELDTELDRLARGLEAAGVRKGDKVLVALRNRPEGLMLPLALTRAGAVAVATSWHVTDRELAHAVTSSGASRVFLDVECPASEAAAGLSPGRVTRVGGEVDGLAPFRSTRRGRHRGTGRAGLVLHTSGTTGRPKAAMRSFGTGDLVQLLRFLEATPLRRGGTHLVVCPLYHATAIGFVSMAWILGSTVVLPLAFEAGAFLEQIERHRVTDTAVVPTMLHRVLELGPVGGRDLSSLRAVFCGGAPLPGRLATDVLATLGDVLFNFYGSTETGLVTLATPADLHRSPTTVGRPLPGVVLKVLGPDGRALPPGEVGELYVRDPSMIETYLGDDAAARASMREGLFGVGDLARIETDGLVHLVGRSRDVVVTGGVKVHAAEVEEVLQAHPSVAAAVVVGRPDDAWGERVVAFVEARAPVDLAALDAWCRQRLSPAKVPKEVHLVDHLPRNPTGKVLKGELSATR